MFMQKEGGAYAVHRVGYFGRARRWVHRVGREGATDTGFGCQRDR